MLPGVTIGEHVTVGANSVVCDDLPSYTVAVGSPARVVRRLHDPAPQVMDADDDEPGGDVAAVRSRPDVMARARLLTTTTTSR